MVCKVLILREVVIAHQILEISHGLCSHAVTYKMDLPLAAPASWNSIGVSYDLVVLDLPQHPWLIDFLLYMLFAVVLVTIDSPYQVWSIVISAYSSLLFESVDAYQLLVQFASSIMEARKRIHNRNINVPVWLYALFQSI